MIDDSDREIPVIRTEMARHPENGLRENRFRWVGASWSLEDEVNAFLDEMSAGGRSVAMYSEPGGELRVEAALAGRSFPSMYFDPRLLRRLASAGMSLRITTGPRTET